MRPAEQFFTALYAGQTGILELRPVEHTGHRFRDFVPVVDGRFDTTRVETFIANMSARRLAAYFGVALRTSQAAIEKKGSGAYCQTLTALFVDADFKHLGEAITRQRLADFPIPPSIIVNSGGGLHPYWLLRQPLNLQNGGYQGARSILRRLAKSVADVVDESVSEPARILRIPGSLNFKKEYGEPRAVVLETV
jgi:hypothetical protein